MTTNELLELVRAGFTKAEIAQITKAESKEPEPAKKAATAIICFLDFLTFNPLSISFYYVMISYPAFLNK